MASEFKRLSIAGACLLAQGCFVFDEKFYKELEQRGNLLDSGDNGDLDSGQGDGDGDGDAPKDAGPKLDGAVKDDGGSEEVELHLVDSCGDKDMYMLHDTHPPIEVSTIGFADDISSNGCFASVPGPEGWMAIDMVAGDRWHFHVAPQNKVGQGQAVQNPALYMRTDCGDNRGCNAGTSLNLCGNGQDEHFTFEATSNARWLFALDDINAAAGTYLLTVAKPICGNAIKEHNEACEDSNTDNGDGCSADCRVELRSDNLTHSEFNDDWTTANLLSVLDVGKPQSVLGSIGGLCDLDMYGFNVPSDNTTLTVTVGPANGPAGGNDCSLNAADATPITGLSLLDSNGRDELMMQGSNDPLVCPTLTMPGLAAGLYYIRVAGDETKKTFSYKMTVKLTK
jgi:cysteine-rich repeat protein